MERYRFKYYLYAEQLLSEEFAAFAMRCIVLQLTLDSTPMNLFHQNASSTVEVFGRTMVGYTATGESRRGAPMLVIPESTKASGVLSAAPISAIHIDELTRVPGWKFLFINCDGTNANKKAVKLLIAELSVHPQLLISVNLCVAHAINSCFIYQSLPRYISSSDIISFVLSVGHV